MRMDGKRSIHAAVTFLTTTPKSLIHFTGHIVFLTTLGFEELRKSPHVNVLVTLDEIWAWKSFKVVYISVCVL